MQMDSQPGGMVASFDKSGNGYLTKGEENLPADHPKLSHWRKLSPLTNGIAQPHPPELAPPFGNPLTLKKKGRQPKLAA